MAALKADNVALSVDKLDCPTGFSGSVPALPYGFFILVGKQVLVEVASEFDNVSFVEKLHDLKAMHCFVLVFQIA